MIYYLFTYLEGYVIISVTDTHRRGLYFDVNKRSVTWSAPVPDHATGTISNNKTQNILEIGHFALRTLDYNKTLHVSLHSSTLQYNETIPVSLHS